MRKEEHSTMPGQTAHGSAGPFLPRLLSLRSLKMAESPTGALRLATTNDWPFSCRSSANLSSISTPVRSTWLMASARDELVHGALHWQAATFPATHQTSRYGMTLVARSDPEIQDIDSQVPIESLSCWMTSS